MFVVTWCNDLYLLSLRILRYQRRAALFYLKLCGSAEEQFPGARMHPAVVIVVARESMRLERSPITARRTDILSLFLSPSLFLSLLKGLELSPSCNFTLHCPSRTPSTAQIVRLIGKSGPGWQSRQSFSPS